jgi:hypothetical protein
VGECVGGCLIVFLNSGIIGRILSSYNSIAQNVDVVSVVCSCISISWSF